MNLKSSYIAQLLTGIVKDVKKQYGVDISPSEADFEIIFNALDRKIIAKDSVILIFSQMNKKSIPELIKKYKLMSDDEVLGVLKKVIKNANTDKISVLMGLAMKELKGKASGQQIMRLLKDLLKDLLE